MNKRDNHNSVSDWRVKSNISCQQYKCTCLQIFHRFTADGALGVNVLKWTVHDEESVVGFTSP